MEIKDRELLAYYQISEEDVQVTVASFIGKDGRVNTLPRKDKAKLILFIKCLDLFSQEQLYSEREVNEIIKKMFDDFAALRRYMVDFGLLERSLDGRVYHMGKDV